MRRLLPFALWLSSAFWGHGCSTSTPAEVWRGPETIGKVASPIVTEASGLAVSRRDPTLLWTHNDSGGEPVLYALGTDGHARGAVRLTGVRNYDWEDIASFELDGRAWLLVAETGNNNADDHDCALFIIAEPDPATLSPDRELTAPVAWRIPVTYPGGPRDCESVAVDARARLVYLISKRTAPPVVYTLPLGAPTGATPAARPIVDLANLPAPTGPTARIEAPWGRYRAWPVGLDISADGRRAVVLTYGEAYVYDRSASETWAQAFARPPQKLPAHNLPQAEAVCFSPDARALYITTEGKSPPLLRYRLQPQP